MNAELRLVVAADAHEGAVYAPDEDALYFTTNRPDVSIRRFGFSDRRLTTVCASTAAANGMTLGRDGRLVVCEQGSLDRPARIAALDRTTGAIETIVDSWHGLPLNSPNDVVVARDGSVWFTDPSYGFLQGFRPKPMLPDRLYRYNPESREVSIAADGFDKPNGLAFSSDESTLYVGDNGAPRQLLAFDVVDGRRLTGRRVIAQLAPEHPDGIKVDRDGFIYATSSDGVHIFAPSGERAGEIRLPGAVNFTFGGPGCDELFITADTAIWGARVAN